jgi:general transcription factor 3C polypeptide 5 (transcription factor C subunit 1)
VNKRTKEVVSVESEIAGLATKTCRFRTLADFQYAPDRNDPIVKLAQDVRDWNETAFDKIDLSLRDDPDCTANDLRNFPPPSFSRQEWQLDYKYVTLNLTILDSSIAHLL